MAWSFDGTNDYVDLAISTATDFPDGDWTVGGLAKFNSLAGTESSGLLATITGSFPADGFVSVYIYQDSFATTGLRGELQFDAADEGTSSAQIQAATSANPFTSNTSWTPIVFRRSGNTVTIWINGSQDGTDTDAAFDAVTPDTAIRLGATFNLAAGRFFNGLMAEWAKWDRALSDAEIAALAKFYAPSFFQNGLRWYCPMIRDYVELKSGLTVTNNGTIIGAHPPVIYPSGPYIIQAPVSAGETFEFAGSQTVSFDGTAALVQTATFSDSQSVSFDGQAAMIQSAALTGAETVSFDGTADTIRNEWSFADSQTVSFDGQAALQQEAAFTGEETVSFDGTATLKQTANLTGAETVSFDGEAALEIAAFIFEGQGVLSFDGSIATLNAILQMEAAQSVSFDGQAALGQEALFEGGATLSFNGLADLTAFQWEAIDTPTTPTWQDVD